MCPCACNKAPREFTNIQVGVLYHREDLVLEPGKQFASVRHATILARLSRPKPQTVLSPEQ
jgi:hypothetical protein